MTSQTIKTEASGGVTSAPSHRVVACLGGDRTGLERRPIPRPGPGEMLLNLRVVGFCGTDLFKLNSGSVTKGQVLGHELVGEAVALGAAVTKFRIGERIAVAHHVPCGVCALCRRGNETMCESFRENLLDPGGFADTILVRARATALAARRVPDHVSDEAAVFMEPAACVLRGIQRAGVVPDGTAVIQGAGSMGLLHLLVLRALHPDLAVLMVDPLAERRATAVTLGASAVAEPGEAAQDQVMAASGGLGADAVFDTVGGAGPLAAALALTRQGGTAILFAHAPDGVRADFDLNALFKFERRIIGSYSGAVKEQEAIFELLANGALDPAPLVTHHLPLDHFEQGVALVREQKALKVLFTPSSS